ncbi:MAG TPA: molybdenum cofactor guanylyltransferase [Fimbriimonadaceae bacterium]|nr:molybdenum cofactor guanylyltransferase [Fimbriimonadaceae bacterium]
MTQIISALIELGSIIAPMSIESVLLTGGASRRMGSDKASLLVEGETLAHRMVTQLVRTCDVVTVLGKEPIDGCAFLQDSEEYAGPLAALSKFSPRAQFVFVASCDLPRFDGNVVPYFASIIEGRDAVIPISGDRPQPLCALYSASAIAKIAPLHQGGVRRLQAWIEQLSAVKVSTEDLIRNGVDPRTAAGANTPEELDAVLKSS